MEEIVVICVVNVIKEFCVIRKMESVCWGVFQVMKEFIVIEVKYKIFMWIIEYLMNSYEFVKLIC